MTGRILLGIDNALDGTYVAVCHEENGEITVLDVRKFDRDPETAFTDDELRQAIAAASPPLGLLLESWCADCKLNVYVSPAVEGKVPATLKDWVSSCGHLDPIKRHLNAQ